MNPAQTALFDVPAGPPSARPGQIRAHRDARAAAAARDEVIAAHEEHSVDMVDRLYRAVAACARSVQSGGTFSTDDVWGSLGDKAEAITEPRAMGAAMKRAAANGVIAATDRYVPSTRPACRARPVRIWRAA